MKVQLCQEPDCQRAAVVSLHFHHLNDGHWCRHNVCQQHMDSIMDSARQRGIPTYDMRIRTQHKGHI